MRFLHKRLDCDSQELLFIYGETYIHANIFRHVLRIRHEPGQYGKMLRFVMQESYK